MGLNGVGSGGNKGNIGGGNASVGAKNNANCSTSVKNNNATKTTTAVKSCGVQAVHTKTGIDAGKNIKDKLSKALDAKALDAKTKKASATDVRQATAGKYYNVQSSVKVTSKVEAKMAELGKKVFEKLDRKVTFSSGYRGPAKQAQAMYDKIKAGSDLSDYKQKGLAKEIKSAYEANKKNKEAALSAMTKVIEKQVANGKYVSSHLRSNAVDISSADKDYYEKISKIVTEMKGTSIYEKKPVHLHIQF
jgi:hypothetical protein